MWFYWEKMGVYLDFMGSRDGIMMGNPWEIKPLFVTAMVAMAF
jgi:hypothetical protein